MVTVRLPRRYEQRALTIEPEDPQRVSKCTPVPVKYVLMKTQTARSEDFITVEVSQVCQAVQASSSLVRGSNNVSPASSATTSRGCISVCSFTTLLSHCSRGKGQRRLTKSYWKRVPITLVSAFAIAFARSRQEHFSRTWTVNGNSICSPSSITLIATMWVFSISFSPLSSAGEIPRTRTRRVMSAILPFPTLPSGTTMWSYFWKRRGLIKTTSSKAPPSLILYQTSWQLYTSQPAFSIEIFTFWHFCEPYLGHTFTYRYKMQLARHLPRRIRGLQSRGPPPRTRFNHRYLG